MKKLRESLQGKSGDQLKDEESRIKVTALRTTSNINSLIRDLFRNPPNYKATVTLSFKPPQTLQVIKSTDLSIPPVYYNVNVQLVFKKAAKNATQVSGTENSVEATGVSKRHAPITFENSPPKARANSDNRNQRQPYVVPTGKFSNNVSHGTGNYSISLSKESLFNSFPMQIIVLAVVGDTGVVGVSGVAVTKCSLYSLLTNKIYT